VTSSSKLDVNELLTPALIVDTDVVRHNIHCKRRIRNAINTESASSQNVGPVQARNGRLPDRTGVDPQRLQLE
jgi:hypothetical protein